MAIAAATRRSAREQENSRLPAVQVLAIRRRGSRLLTEGSTPIETTGLNDAMAPGAITLSRRVKILVPFSTISLQALR
jgi:hypothetical protein